MKIFIPMAGRGTRLRPFTLSRPKPLLEIIDKGFFNKIKKNHLYIVDPLGNIFMYYNKDFNAKGLKKDIKKILRISRIG